MNKQLHIKLISPKMSLRPMDSEFKRRMSPSLSLVTIASLTPKEHRVTIADENISKLSFKDNPDIVGINVNVDTSERAKEIASIYRGKGSCVIFGGIHASATPFTLTDYCDSICIGEAEEIWPRMLNDFSQNNLKKFYQNKSGIALSDFPIPNWNVINASKYLYTNIVITSRGCPFKCEFCYNSCNYVNNSYRTRPLNHVLREIDSLKTRQVYFIDDNFIGDVNYCNSLIEELKKRNLIWHAAVSTNLVNHGWLIEKMADSGCKSLFIGFETVNQQSLNEMNKKQNKIKKYEELISQLHKKAIMVNASLVFGFDNHTREIFQETLNWLIKNKVETMTGHILTPYPGTKLYKKLFNENRIIDNNLSHYNTSNVVFRPQLMTAKELREGYLWIYREFYKHKNIFRRIPESRKNYFPYFLFNYGYRKYGKQIANISKTLFMSKVGNLSRYLSYGIG